jgi:hypothetical protein
MKVITLLQFRDLSDEVIVFLLNALADESISESMTVEVADLLEKNYSDVIAMNVLPYIGPIEKALANMAPKVWAPFSKFIWRFKYGRDGLLAMAERNRDRSYYPVILARLQGTPPTKLQVLAMIRDIQHNVGTVLHTLDRYSDAIPEAIPELFVHLAAASDPVIDGIGEAGKKLIRTHPDNSARLGDAIRRLIRGSSTPAGWNVRRTDQVEQFRGLTNIGHSCYMNSSLQQVLHLPIC